MFVTVQFPGPTLADKLGRDPSTRPIVFNGDDLGMCRAQNEGTLEALSEGHLSSATLMVPCPWAYAAACDAVAAGVAVGVHLTLTSESDRYRWRAVSGHQSLADADGFLPRDLVGLYASADLEAVRAECIAQVDQALAWGLDVTHIDSHMGANQIDPGFFEVYLDVAATFDLPMRMAPLPLEAPQGFTQRHAAAERGIWFCDDLILGMGGAAEWRSLLDQRRAGVTEVFVHAALDGPEIRAVAADAAQRVIDHQLATAEDSPFAAVERVTYSEIRDAQRTARTEG